MKANPFMDLAIVLALAAPAATAQKTIGLIVDAAPGVAGTALMAEFRQETERVLKLDNARLTWREMGVSGVNESFDRLAVLRLTGSCDPHGLTAPAKGLALGMTHVSNGRILPFIEIHCERVVAVLAPRLGQQNPRVDAGIIARALARVAAHEIYHVLAHTAEHDTTGLAKEALSLNDLYGHDVSMSARSLRAIEESLDGGRRAAEFTASVKSH